MFFPVSITFPFLTLGQSLVCYYSARMPGMILSQGLCTFCSLCLACFSNSYLYDLVIFLTTSDIDQCITFSGKPSLSNLYTIVITTITQTISIYLLCFDIIHHMHIHDILHVLTHKVYEKIYVFLLYPQCLDHFLIHGSLSSCGKIK